MCLNSVNDKKEHADIISKLIEDKDGYITVYKGVNIYCDDDEYYPMVMTFKGAYKTGLNKAKRLFFLKRSWEFDVNTGKMYRHGFYCCVDKKTIKDYQYNVIPVKIRKEWITVSGYQMGYGNIVISKNIIMPEYEPK